MIENFFNFMKLVFCFRAKLIEEVEKHSPSLNRNAKYERKAEISRLPAYLTIQFVRFFFKENSKVNAKILKGKL